MARTLEYSPGYWRKLRCALVYHQRLLNFPDAAERIQALSRPDIPVKTKQKRVKKIENDDLVALIQYFKACNDKAILAAMLLFMCAGIRPAELATITAQGNRLTVIGAKKVIMANVVLIGSYSLCRGLIIPDTILGGRVATMT